MSSDPLFPCCQSSVAGTSHFGIRSHARRYSDLAIPSSLKLLARVHCGDLAYHLVANVGRSEIYCIFRSLFVSAFCAARAPPSFPNSNSNFRVDLATVKATSPDANH